MPPMVKYRLASNDDDLARTLESAGFLPYGDDVVVWVSPRLGDPLLWAYLMSVGGAAFFCSDYVVVQAPTVEELVDRVTTELTSTPKVYLLHGPPDVRPGCWRQTLMKWDPTHSIVRGRQLFGAFVVGHYGEKGTEEPQEEQEEEDKEEEEPAEPLLSKEEKTKLAKALKEEEARKKKELQEENNEILKQFEPDASDWLR